jgi:hypothetical protein
MNTAAPTIHTHGEAYQLPPPSPLLISTSTWVDFYCANKTILVNTVNKVKYAFFITIVFLLIEKNDAINFHEAASVQIKLPY